MNGQQQQQQIQIKALDEILKGVYANNMQVGHTKEEFIFDFINLFPPQGILTSRVIMSPGHAKRVLRALDENIKKYEQKFGKIAEAEGPKEDFGFKG